MGADNGAAVEGVGEVSSVTADVTGGVVLHVVVGVEDDVEGDTLTNEGLETDTSLVVVVGGCPPGGGGGGINAAGSF